MPIADLSASEQGADKSAIIRINLRTVGLRKREKNAEQKHAKDETKALSELIWREVDLVQNLINKGIGLLFHRLSPAKDAPWVLIRS